MTELDTIGDDLDTFDNVDATANHSTRRKRAFGDGLFWATILIACCMFLGSVLGEWLFRQFVWGMYFGWVLGSVIAFTVSITIEAMARLR